MTGLHRTGEQGPRLLLSHCSLAHSGAWKGVLGHLGPVQAQALDLPGHGMSEADPDRRPRRQAADALLEVLGDEPAHLVGHSFGGGVVLRAALDRPEAVASLTLIEPMMFYLLDPADPIAIDEAAATAGYINAVQNDQAELAAEEFMTLWGNGVPWAMVPEKLRTYAIERMGFITASADDVAGRGPDQITVEQIASLPCPVQLIAGAQTRRSAIAICDTIAQPLGITPHLVQGAGHMVPISHPAEVAKLIGAML